MSHIWEVPSFSARYPGEPTTFRDVLRWIPNGIAGFDDEVNLPSLLASTERESTPFHVANAEKWAGLSEGNVVRSFIITPAYLVGGDGPPEYNDIKPGGLRYAMRVEMLKQKLNSWVPNSQAEVIPYPQDWWQKKKAVDYFKFHTARGKILFQYDPKERVQGEEDGGWKGSGMRRAEV